MLDPTLILVNGVTYASWLFLVAVGLTLIYGVMNILNVAHGSLYALGAYAAAWSVGEYMATGAPVFVTYGLLLAAALVVGLALGPLIERGVLRWLYDRDEIVVVLATFALFLILEDTIKLVFGVQSYLPYQPYTALGFVDVGPVPFAVYELGLVALSAVTGGLVWFGLNRTRTGKLLQAVIHDREVSLALGIDVRRVFLATFTVGAILGAMGGAFTAPMISVVPGVGGRGHRARLRRRRHRRSRQHRGSGDRRPARPASAARSRSARCPSSSCSSSTASWRWFSSRARRACSAVPRPARSDRRCARTPPLPD